MYGVRRKINKFMLVVMLCNVHFFFAVITCVVSIFVIHFLYVSIYNLVCECFFNITLALVLVMTILKCVMTKKSRFICVYDKVGF